MYTAPEDYVKTVNLRHQKYTETTPLVAIWKVLSVVNKIAAYNGSVIAFAKIKSKLITRFRLSENNTLVKEHDPHPQIFVYQRSTVSLQIQRTLCICICKRMSPQSAHLWSPHIRASLQYTAYTRAAVTPCHTLQRLLQRFTTPLSDYPDNQSINRFIGKW